MGRRLQNSGRGLQCAAFRYLPHTVGLWLSPIRVRRSKLWRRRGSDWLGSLPHSKCGKTGSRSVVAHRCVPALLKWMDAHPTKRPEDPLWVVESELLNSQQQRLRIKRYAYPAMKKRLKMTGQRAGIRKPLDFYSLRHSSCVLDKAGNEAAHLAAKKLKKENIRSQRFKLPAGYDVNQYLTNP